MDGRRLLSTDYREAWARLLETRLLADRKNDLKAALIERWAVRDFEAALAAAREEDDPDLLEVLERAAAQHPEWYRGDDPAAPWDLKWGWLGAMIQAEPALVGKYLDQVEADKRGDALEKCLVALEGDSVGRKAFAGEVAGLPDSPENRRLWQSLCKALASTDADPGHGLSAGELLHAMQEAESPGQRYCLLVGLSKLLGEMEGQREAVRGLMEGIPAELQDTAARLVLRDTSSAAVSMDLVDLLIRRGDWMGVAGRGFNSTVWEVSDSGERQMLREWAERLPERDETAGLYRQIQIVTLREGGDADVCLERARVTVEALPEGWKRDQAAAAWADVALWPRYEPEQAEEAIRRIGDDRLRSMVRSRLEEKASFEQTKLSEMEDSRKAGESPRAK